MVDQSGEIKPIEPQYGMSKEDLIRKIQSASWDRFTAIGYVGQEPQVFTSERGMTKVLDNIKQSFPQLHTELTP